MAEIVKRIPTLEGASNFSEWKSRIQALLLEKGYLIYNRTDNSLDFVPETDIKAGALIKIYISSSILHHLEYIHFPTPILKKLEELYKPSGPTYNFLLIREFFTINLASCSSVDDYILKIKKTINELAARTIIIPEKVLIGWTLFNLTSEYDFIVASINQSLRLNQEISLERIFSQILDESRRINMNSIDQDIEMSINSRKGNNRAKNQSYNNKNRKNNGFKRTYKYYKC